MCREKSLICVSVVLFVFSGSFTLGDCPSTDLTGDCAVDVNDLSDFVLW
jgi:hypothetical protein